MWTPLIAALTENDPSYIATRNRLLAAAAFTFILTLFLGILAFSSPERGSFEKAVYNPSEESFEFLGTSSPSAFLLRMLSDWVVFGLGLSVFVGGLYNHILGKPVSYLIFACAFFLAVLGSLFQSLSLSRLIYSGQSPKTYLIFSWFTLRFLILCALSIALLLSLSTKKKAFYSALFLFAFLLYGFTHYTLISHDAFHLLFGKNLLTLTLFYLPFPLELFFLLPLLLVYIKKAPSYFSYTLLLFLFPQIILDVAAVFNKHLVLDSGLNALHLLEVVALTLPLIGLTWDLFGFYHKLEKEKGKTVRATESKLFFLSSISKDLEFAIARLRGYTEELKTIAEAKYQEIAFGVRGASRTIEIVIENLLSLSAFETGRMIVEKRPFPLKPFIEKCKKMHTLQEKGSQGGDLPLLTDPKRLSQVIANTCSFFRHQELTLEIKEDQKKALFIIEGSNKKWSQKDFEAVLVPLMKKQVKESVLLKYQLITDAAKRLMQELGGSWKIEWEGKLLKATVEIAQEDKGK